MHSKLGFPRAAAVLTFPLLSCVTPTSQLGSVSPDVVRAEQLKQQQLVLQSEIDDQLRVANLAFPMLRAAVPLCGQWITTRLGIYTMNIHTVNKEYREAAAAMGLNDTLRVVAVTKDAAGDRAGVRVGDHITSLSNIPVTPGRDAMARFASAVAPTPNRRGEPPLASSPYTLNVVRPPTTSAASLVALRVQADTVCAYDPVAVKDPALNAWADGQRVVFTTAMLRFASNDDELAAVVAHEIAHNAMRHIDAKKKNATLGALFGAVLDVAAATQGVNTGGDFTNQGAAIGAMSYSQDFEREADYVGMYILARSGRDMSRAPNLWRRMAQEAPGSIKYASSHPTSAERFVRLEQVIAEIQKKKEAGLPLLPESKKQ